MSLSHQQASRQTSGIASTRRRLGISKSSITGAVIALSLAGVAAPLSPNPLLILESGGLLALLFLLLWQENEPPILMFPAVFQWLVVSVKPLMTVFTGLPVNSFAEYDSDLASGAPFAMAAVAALGIGLRFGAGKPMQNWNAALKNETYLLSRESILKVALSTILLGHSLFFLMRFAGPLSQIVYALAGVRFVGLFALAYWCFTNRTAYQYLIVVVLIEIAIGITGFFADFKTPIFIISLAALASSHKVKVKDAAMLTSILAVLLYLGAFWSDIKMPYRNFVTGGSNEQVIAVPLEDRINYIVSEAKTFDRARFVRGTDMLLSRLSYIDYLSATMEHVPEAIPHENGARLWKSVVHILTPRFLFPDKAATEFDSEVTAKYTGLPLQVREGTSISIGYVGELYIDFGVIGAIIAVGLLGGAIGYGYRLLRGIGRGSVLLLYGVRAMVALSIVAFETALIKYIGGIAIALIAGYLLQRYVLPWLSRKLRLKTTPQPAYRRGYAY